MLTETQKKTAQAIIQIFETSRVLGNYGQVTLLRGDTGHLTYGKAQTTLGSGNLALLIDAYCDAEGAAFATELKPYLPHLQSRDLTLDHDRPFKALLREAGDDLVMHDVQDAFFDRVYWQPAMRSLAFIGGTKALTATAVYDGTIHGSWRAMRDRTNRKHGKLANLGEEAWVKAYVETRSDWLGTHRNTLLHRTVYRMDTFLALIADKVWDLPLPLTVRGVRIDENALAGEVRASAADDEERVLRLTRPFMRGKDVKDLQRLLKKHKIRVSLDGIFGSDTERAVIRFQLKAELEVDGAVGPATWAALEDV